jgi:hypothetical protein
MPKRRAVMLTICSLLLLTGPVPPASDEYVFVSDVERPVGLRRGDLILKGRLDPAGNFVQTESGSLTMGGSAVRVYKVINLSPPGGPPKRVYEFRSGRLIKGEISATGDFVPEVGSKIIKFEEYKYSPDAPPIWNLPGYFKKVEKAKDGKDAKK